MSFDLQLLRDRIPAPLSTRREHAIYLDAQRSGEKTRLAHNVADLLERGHRARPSAHTALLIDLKA